MKQTTKTQERNRGKNERIETAQISPRILDSIEREDLISARAYEMWLRRGCTHGYDVADWLEAENELIAEALLMSQTDR